LLDNLPVLHNDPQRRTVVCLVQPSTRLAGSSDEDLVDSFLEAEWRGTLIPDFTGWTGPAPWIIGFVVVGSPT
jgi:hypothetical protein